MRTQTVTSLSIPSANCVKCVQDAFHEVFGVMLGMKVTLCENQTVVPGLTAIVGLVGSICGIFSIQCSREIGRTLAARMLGTAAGHEDEVLDALGELCNMLAGSFKSGIPGVADTCMLSVPTTIAGENYHVRALPGGQRFEMQMECDGNLMQTILHLNR